MAASSSSTTPSSSSSPFPPASSKQIKKNNTADLPSRCPAPNSLRKHSPSAILDLLILLIVTFSASFLIFSLVSYIFKCLSLLLPALPSFSLSTLVSKLKLLNPGPEVFIYSCTMTAAVFLVIICRICFHPRFRACGREGCKGFWNAMEYDLKLQDEETLRTGNMIDAFKDIDELPWKGNENCHEYETVREQLKNLAPENGRAVLIFRHRCGCPYAKLEGWAPREVRRPKRGNGNRC